MNKPLKRKIQLFIICSQLLAREGLILLTQQDEDIKVIGDAADDEAGVTGIDTLQPDVVIVADGWGGEDCSCADTVKKIKAYHPHIPILVVSPHVENARVQMALAAGANGYLPMGIDIDELVRVLYTVNRGELTLHPSLLPAILQQLEAETGGKSTATNPDDLTKRESDILSALSRGLTDREIAQQLSISVRTVQSHLAHIYEKLHVHSRTEAALIAVQHKHE
jgi:two-component system NarL family response regulator